MTTAIILCYLIVIVLTAILATTTGLRAWVLAKFPWAQQSDTAAPYFSYNAAHCLGGLVAVLLAMRWTPLTIWEVAAWVLIVAAAKEGIYDRVFELPVQTNKLDLTDFCGYAVGDAIGVVIWIWF